MGKSAPPKVGIAGLKKKIVVRFGIAPFVLAALFFIPAGTLDYWQAWLYGAVLLVPMFLAVFYFLRRDPALLERRIRMKEKVEAQRAIIKSTYLPFIIGYLVPGLDRRFGWSNVPLELVIFSDAMVLLGYIGFFFVMRENSYASRIIEVEKGQKVISTGPYAIVRHPMYSAMLLLYLFTPFALGSYLALPFFLLIVPVIVLRLLNEEKVLLKGLKGYKEYCRKVRHRLIPLVW